MTNDDLKRFYPLGGDIDNKEDFVRYDDDGSLGVKATDIDPGTATAGQSLIANGSGGVSWADIVAKTVDSTGVTAGRVLIADGSGGNEWRLVLASSIGSGEAPEGAVLVATGSGGATWGGMAAGISFTDPDSDGNIVISEVNS